MKELLTGSKNLPFTLIKKIPKGRAMNMIKKLEDLGDRIELQNSN